MTLRPEDLGKDFIVERKAQTISKGGRKVVEFKATGTRLNGCLSEAKTMEIERWKQLQHPITHTIVVRGGFVPAQVGDRLVLGGRRFYIQGIDNIGALNLFTQVFAEERSDADG